MSELLPLFHAVDHLAANEQQGANDAAGEASTRWQNNAEAQHLKRANQQDYKSDHRHVTEDTPREFVELHVPRSSAILHRCLSAAHQRADDSAIRVSLTAPATHPPRGRGSVPVLSLHSCSGSAGFSFGGCR